MAMRRARERVTGPVAVVLAVAVALARGAADDDDASSNELAGSACDAERHSDSSTVTLT